MSVEDLIKEGISWYEKGKKNKAVSCFRKALDLDPQNTDALFNLAEIFLQLEKYPKAKEYALKLLQISPNDWAAHDILAACYQFEGFYDKALDHLKKALQLAPSEAITHLKERLDALKYRINQVKNMKKLAIICAKGLDNFIDDIVKGLSDEYWVQRWAVTNEKEIKAAMDWADIVWLEWANEVAIVGTNYPAAWTKPVVVRLHSYEIFTDMPLKIHWPVVDTLIFVAPHIREILFERFPELRLKIRRTEIVYNGIDLSKIPFKERKPGYEIAWVGHINYKKAPELALQIIKKLVDIDPRYKLHFAGDFQDPRYEVYMKHMVKIMGLENNVIFHGWVDDMDEFWEDKNYLLHTSLHEGHPYAVMEAMARGIKPVIHWFRGADRLYKKDWIYETVDEAVNIIIRGDYDSNEFRKKAGFYSVDKMIGNIKNFLSLCYFEVKNFKLDSLVLASKLRVSIVGNLDIKGDLLDVRKFSDIEDAKKWSRVIIVDPKSTEIKSFKNFDGLLFIYTRDHTLALKDKDISTISRVIHRLDEKTIINEFLKYMSKMNRRLKLKGLIILKSNDHVKVFERVTKVFDKVFDIKIRQPGEHFSLDNADFVITDIVNLNLDKVHKVTVLLTDEEVTSEIANNFNVIIPSILSANSKSFRILLRDMVTIIDNLLIKEKFLRIFKRIAELNQDLAVYIKDNLNLTVLIPTYNRSEILVSDMVSGLKLGSVNKIIIDDGSDLYHRENLKALVDFPNTKLIWLQQNSGKVKAIRKGLMHARADNILVLDDDDIVMVTDAMRFSEYVRSISECDMLIPEQIIGVDKSGHMFPNRNRSDMHLGYSAQLILRDFVETGHIRTLMAGAILKKKNLIQVINEDDLPVHDDYFILFRLLSLCKNLRIYPTNSYVYIRRMHSKNLGNETLVYSFYSFIAAMYHMKLIGITDGSNLSRLLEIWFKSNKKLWNSFNKEVVFELKDLTRRFLLGELDQREYAKITSSYLQKPRNIPYEIREFK